MNRKKRIIFVLNSMPSGGVEKSFLSYLSLFAPSRHDLTVLLIHKTGEWLHQLPAWVRVQEVCLREEDRRDVSLGTTDMVRAALRRWDWRRLCVIAWRFLKPRARESCIGLMNSFIMDAVKSARSLYPADFSFSYDLVVSYGCYCHSAMVAVALLQGHKSAVWFHSEDQFSTEGVGYYKRLYARFDHRYCASAALAQSHNRDYCGGTSLFEHFPHYVNAASLKGQSNAYSAWKDSSSHVHLLTVGRLSGQKGVDIAIETLRILRANGFDVVWHWVGGGTEEKANEYRRLAEKAGVSSFFFFEGLRDNPYPFFDACDIYVQPSRFEGYCLTVAEARVFAKPIVCTDFSGAREQLESGVTGTIVSKPDAKKIAEAIADLLCRPELRRTYCESLKMESADTVSRVRTLWDELLTERS